jgi:hypothetical protein
MPNGDLESVLLKEMDPNHAKDLLFYPLDWIVSLNIAIGGMLITISSHNADI